LTTATKTKSKSKKNNDTPETENNGGENATEESDTPMSVTLSCETWDDSFDPNTINIKKNIRPTSKERAEQISRSIEERGLDRAPWLVIHTTDELGNPLSEPERVSLDGGHRILGCILLQKRNPERFNELFPGGVIPCECRGPFETDLQFHLAQVQLNEGQEAISADPLAAMLAAGTLEKDGASQTTIADALTLSQAWVSRHLKALKSCIGPIKTQVRNGKLTLKTMLDAAHLDEDHQGKLLEKIAKATKGLPEKEIRKAERRITEEAVRSFRAKKGNDGDGKKTPIRFPKALPKAEIVHTVADNFRKIAGKKKGDMSESNNNTKAFIAGIMYAFGHADAEHLLETHNLGQIEAWFRESVGRDITADENLA
jgi:predicted transcriptional regulator